MACDQGAVQIEASSVIASISIVVGVDWDSPLSGLKLRALCRSSSLRAQQDVSLTTSSDISQDLELNADSSPSDQERDEDGGLTQMSSLCPLWDSMLPLDAAMLKSKQVRPRCRAEKLCIERSAGSSNTLCQIQ